MAVFFLLSQVAVADVGSEAEETLKTSVDKVFSILVFSNFIPTILFGLLTGLAMLIAIVTALSLLPLLIITLNRSGNRLFALKPGQAVRGYAFISQ